MALVVRDCPAERASSAGAWSARRQSSRAGHGTAGIDWLRCTRPFAATAISSPRLPSVRRDCHQFAATAISSPRLPSDRPGSYRTVPRAIAPFWLPGDRALL